MAQLVDRLASELDNLSVIPGTHMIEKENQDLPELSSIHVPRP